MSDIPDRLETAREEIEDRLAAAADEKVLREIEISILGKKGLVQNFMRELGGLSKEEKPAAGKLINEYKQRFTQMIDARKLRLADSAMDAEIDKAALIDVTLPGSDFERGSLHPVTLVQSRLEDIFTGMGFMIADGPEAETDYFNFEALNFPPGHPAREMQDTIWLKNGMLLRTHTSPVQVRTMQRLKPPIKVIVPGRCFRFEEIDPSHENTFYQMEGLMVDKGISIANLIAVMNVLLEEVFERKLKTRLRPGYFPFVEPGFEMDMSCLICGGEGCPTCKNTGWIEILPCGMVHPNVLRHGNIDPDEYTGFAFGLGLTRLAMMKYGLSDIRVLNSGDLRVLKQFGTWEV